MAVIEITFTDRAAEKLRRLAAKENIDIPEVLARAVDLYELLVEGEAKGLKLATYDEQSKTLTLIEFARFTSKPKDRPKDSGRS